MRESGKKCPVKLLRSELVEAFLRRILYIETEALIGALTLREDLPKGCGSVCAEKIKLFQEYQKAAADWSRATEHVGNSSESFIDRARDLREAALKAKADYDDHKCANC